MAKSPNSKKAKDPARPTRAKAAREPLAPIAPALEKLLNPGIAKGTAGVGSQTGLQAACRTTHGTAVRIFPPRIRRGSRRETWRRTLRSPPPCGEGSGVGVERLMLAPARHTSTPLPNPPPQGGREHTARGEGTSSRNRLLRSPAGRNTHRRRRAGRSLAGARARARARRRRGVVPGAAVRAAEARAPPDGARRHPVDGRRRHRRVAGQAAARGPRRIPQARSPGRRIARRGRRNPKAASGS